MDSQTLLIALGVLALLLVVGFLRYEGSAEGGFSIGDFLKFGFKGSGSTDNGDQEQTGVDIGGEAQVHAERIVGRDYVETTNIHQGEHPRPLPNLKLYLIDRSGHSLNEVTVLQSAARTTNDITFRLRLKNEKEGTNARGIGITLEFSWRGDDISKAIKFFRPSIPRDWSIDEDSIHNGTPAHLSLNDSDLICYFAQSIDWPPFRFHTPEKVSGYILLQYTLASDEPRTDETGDLIIRIE